MVSDPADLTVSHASVLTSEAELIISCLVGSTHDQACFEEIC